MKPKIRLVRIVPLLLALTLSFFDSSSGQSPVWRKVLGNSEVVSGIDVYPTDPDTVCALTTRRHVLSTDGGETWDSISSVGNSEGAIRTDALNSQILYAALHSTSMFGNDIFRTTDGGRLDWDRVFEGSIYPVRVIERDPIDLSTMYVGKSPAWIFRTTNHGLSWDTLAHPVGGGYTTSLAIAKSNNNVLYVGGLQNAFRSSDRGDSWTPLDFGFPIPGGVEFAVDPRDENVVYAGLFAPANYPGGMYKSTDGGQVWREINVGLTDSVRTITTLLLNPKKPDELFLGRARTGTSADDRQVFRTTDGGETWSDFSSGIPMYVSIYSLTGVSVEENGKPQQFTLQAFPNPFNPRTEIRFELTESSSIHLTVYDMLGREIAILTEGMREAGLHRVAWNAQGQSSGIYFLRLSTQGKDTGEHRALFQKLVLIK